MQGIILFQLKAYITVLSQYCTYSLFPSNAGKMFLVDNNLSWFKKQLIIYSIADNEA